MKGHTVQKYHERGEVVVALPLSPACVTEIVKAVGTHELVELVIGHLVAAAAVPYIVVPLTVIEAWEVVKGCNPVPVLKGHTKPINVIKLHMKY